MWRPKWLSRTSGDSVPETGTQDVPEPDTGQDMEQDVPPWVTEFRRWGVPAAAVLVLVLCAPGERFLALLVGWNEWMSWGMAGLFTLYAGLAAVISTQFPKGARGKASSIVGAVVSLALAMGAQPVAHLFVTGYLSAEPRPPLWLIGTVSSIPPLILGHLLHFAAMQGRPARRPVPEGTSRKDKGQRDNVVPIRPAPAVPPPPGPVPPVSAARPAPAVPASRPVVSKVSVSVPSLVPSPSVPASVPAGVPHTSSGTGTPVRPSMGARALSLLRDGTPDYKVTETLNREYADNGTPPKPDTVRKSINRAKAKLSQP